MGSSQIFRGDPAVPAGEERSLLFLARCIKYLLQSASEASREMGSSPELLLCMTMDRYFILLQLSCVGRSMDYPIQVWLLKRNRARGLALSWLVFTDFPTSYFRSHTRAVLFLSSIFLIYATYFLLKSSLTLTS